MSNEIMIWEAYRDRSSASYLAPRHRGAGLVDRLRIPGYPSWGSPQRAHPCHSSRHGAGQDISCRPSVHRLALALGL